MWHVRDCLSALLLTGLPPGDFCTPTQWDTICRQLAGTLCKETVVQERSGSFIDLAMVLLFVDRAVERGVPTRVALSRAAKRYQLDRELIRAAYRSGR